MEASETIDLTDIYSFFKDYNLQFFDNSYTILDIIKSFLDQYDNDNAFYIVDLSKIINQYHRWIENLPTIKPYYAIKCNPNNVIIELLAKLQKLTQ